MQWEAQTSSFQEIKDEDNQSSSSPYQSNSRTPINPPVNKGTSNIFFKTRVCAKFRAGNCRNGENCNFAHGVEDLRQPPPNWQELVGARGDEERSSGNWEDDQRIIHRMKLCKKFYNGEECPYGERCNFLHEDPAKFRDDNRFRESSAISIGTTPPPVVHGSGGTQSEVNRSANNNNMMMMMKPVYWKTKLCTKWETTSHCPFSDKCHFAHGQAELQMFVGRVEGDGGNTTSTVAKPNIVAANDASMMKTVVSGPVLQEEGQGKKCLFKWKGPKKINRIYA
ncbi:zinc finger CCCH domain-containing protein 39, partial [Carica papaya]|uniref:zinc finger CCCH domain-containing protein 39 n=1 Tax=Carica papaya TaxID=3649 RepID=UPI000B8C7540